MSPLLAASVTGDAERDEIPALSSEGRALDGGSLLGACCE
jgi:hypothetical protein